MKKNLILDNFSQRLVSIRKKNGLTQDEFSVKTGIHKQSLVRYENKKHNRFPDVPFLINLIILFQVNIHWLLTGEGDMSLEEENKKVKLPEDLKEIFELIQAIPEIKQTLLAKLTESKAIFNKEIEEYRKKIENKDEAPEIKTAG